MSGSLERLFSGFVSGLRQRNTRHAFLRGYADYPSVPEGSDVDMLVHPRDLEHAESAFRESAIRQGFHIWQHFRSGCITRFFAYAFHPEARHVFFDLDIHTAEASYGMPYFRASALLSLVVQDDGLRRLPAPVEAMVNGLGHFLIAGSIPEKHRQAWRLHAADEAARKLLQKVLGKPDAALVLANLEAESAEEFAEQARQIGKRARRRVFLWNPIGAGFGFCSFGLGERLVPWFSPRGRFLIFAGTDGSGKTTLIREVLAKIAPRFREGCVEEHHLRPKILPQISSLFHGGKPAYTIEDMSDPHRAAPSGFVGSCLRTLYYWFDYLIGYPLKILPRRRRNALIIYDRWFYDHVVDPRRFRIAQGHPLPGLLQRFLPKPDRLLVCTADPDVILQRKQELAPAEVARQVEEFQSFAKFNPRATLVNTSSSIEDCVDQIIRAVFGGDAA